VKNFWKVFIVSFFFFIFAIFLGSYSYMKFNNQRLSTSIGGGLGEKGEQPKEEEDAEVKTYKSLTEAFKDDNRLNVLLLGLEEVRTDTIIFASFNFKSKKLDAISIPRDTYIHRKGFDRPEDRKINAIYGQHGLDGVKRAVSYILEGAPIHHHIILDYEGVEKIIDSVGGVEVVVPFHMKYDDPTANPPLKIDIKEGKQLLDGKKALGFLRYRQGNNNKGGYIDGDLGRIRAQQQFLKSFVDKALSFRLPILARTVLEQVETDIRLWEGLSYSTRALGIKPEDIRFMTLPGEGELKWIQGRMLSYFIYDSEEVKKVLEEIFNVKRDSP